MNTLDRIANKIWRSIYLPKARIDLNKVCFFIPRYLHHNFYKSRYEKEDWFLYFLSMINKNRPIKTFFDVGSNVGQTLLKIKSINKSINYYGFEPNPFCCAITDHIVSVNQLPNCNIIPCGLSDDNKILKLNLAGDNPSDASASIIEDFRKSNDTEKLKYVNVHKLDDISHQIDCNDIDIIKIDVEGAELEAVKGMVNTITKFSPIVIIEVLPSYNKDNLPRVSRQLELSYILKDIGYSIFHIIEKGTTPTLNEVIEFPIHENVNLSDYILFPKDINPTELGFKIIE